MRAIFLDRDGVINRKAPEGEYVTDLSEFQLLPGALDAISRMFRCGYQVFIVTNQRGIATGKILPERLEEIHSTLSASLGKVGVPVSKIYVCPHDRTDNCECRKPRSGMLLLAAREFDLDLPASWMIGDSESDIIAGRNAGCRTVLIASQAPGWSSDVVPDLTCPNLEAAAGHVCGSIGDPKLTASL